MSIFSKTIDLRFNAARRLSKYRGRLSNIHGHDFAVKVEVTSERLRPAQKTPPSMVIDNSVIYRILEEIIVETFDCSIILANDDPLASYLFNFPGKRLKVIILPESYYDATTECLAHYFYSLLKNSNIESEYGVEIKSVEVSEQYSSSKFKG